MGTRVQNDEPYPYPLFTFPAPEGNKILRFGSSFTATHTHAMLRSLRAVAASTTAAATCHRATTAVVLTTTTIRGLAAQAGTVKFYLRDKGYGFIQPDANPDTDVFVHRNNISCTHNIPKEVADYSQRYPYLKKDERILFEIDYEQSTGLRKAFNVTWLNGSRIPPERSNFLGRTPLAVR
jgi:hypothetical protein